MRALVLALILLAGGCVSDGGRATRTHIKLRGQKTEITVPTPHGRVTVPPGAEVEVTIEDAQQPDNAADSATIAGDGQGGYAVSTGASHGATALDGQTGILTFCGIGLIIIGALFFLVQFKFPALKALPRATGPVLAGVGGAFLFAPTIIERYSLYVFLAAAVGIVGLVAWLIYRFSRKHHTASVAVQGVEELRKEFAVGPESRERFDDALRRKSDDAAKAEVKRLKKGMV